MKGYVDVVDTNMDMDGDIRCILDRFLDTGRKP